ncbi:hypothetical protein F66182_5445 [Fusarium sp. NRRL 66182]|nr:hypothetical protein F66182_5445 [Fusarium sp. NRRL 66182]
MGSPYFASDAGPSSYFQPEIASGNITSQYQHGDQEEVGVGSAVKNDAEITPEEMEDIPLSNGDPSNEEEDWEVPSGLELATAQVASRTIQPAESGSSFGQFNVPRFCIKKPARPALRFDDEDMLAVSLNKRMDEEGEEDEEEEEEEEEDDDDDEEEEPQHPLAGFEVLFSGDSEGEYTWEQLHPHAARAIAFVQSIPAVQTLRETAAATSHIAQNNITRSYSDVSERVRHTARRTCEAVVVTGQVSGYLAGEALTAGQGMVGRAHAAGQEMVARVQDNWAGWTNPLNYGIFERVGEFVAEGAQALPPADSSIVRPRRRR